ncbi:MAG TPA: YkgJ family cysteine cluster protein [Fibrobacteria bacterium]|jgi:Fe-S-cluster containining protein|nr:YkgJ family cysteine cluster protein [Fibrobacteria bacterium]
MTAPQIAASGSGAEETSALLTAIEALKAGLESLAVTEESQAVIESPEYYPRLTALLARLVPPLHAAYDACVARVLITEGRKTACSKACSACCSHFVASVEPFELLALDAEIKRRPDYAEKIVSSFRKSTVYDGLLAREHEAGVPDEEADDRATYRYFLKGLPCAFLEADGSCGVYDQRPMACRMFFAESSPRFCSGQYLASPWNRNFQVEMPQEVEEALARCSRLLEHLALPDGLFPGLVAVNALFGRYESNSDSAASSPPKG